jgi:ABC-type transporter Mla MlaB component
LTLGMSIAFGSSASAKHMLRITVLDEPDQVTLKLEGTLGGIWVAELEDSWRGANATLDGRSFRLDLTAVDRVDSAGNYLLALLRRNGVQLIASGTTMSDLVRSIARDWPLNK